MGLNACWGVLCALACILPCLSQEEMLSVVVDVQGDSVSVQMEGQLDICNTFACPQGTKCEVQMSPALLKIPMPRCVPDKTAKPRVDGCKEISVATNILQCRSQKEWFQVGGTQCQLTTLQGRPTTLISSRPFHVCPPLSFPPKIRYLSATFNCCVDGIAVETTSQPEVHTQRENAESVDARVAAVKTEAAQSAAPVDVDRVQEVEAVTTEKSKQGLQYVKDKLNDLGQEAIKLTGMDSTESTQQTSSLFYLLLLILGLSFLLSFLLISLLISLRLKQRRRQRTHKGAVTSVINHGAADAELDHAVHFSNDKAILVDNMQITH